MPQLCRICNKKDKGVVWLPTTMNNFEVIISKKISGESPKESTFVAGGKMLTSVTASPRNYEYGLRKNICYSLQYLEYLLATNNQLYLTPVLTFQNYKTFIIVSASVVEGILYHELKIKNLQSKDNWNSLGKTSSQKKVHEKLHQFVTEIFEQVDQHDKSMTFDQIIDKVETKKLLGETDEKIYCDINALRKLRNKIHIHLTTSRHDTDYNSFNSEKLDFAKNTLLNVLRMYFCLTDEEVQDTFSFLLPERKDLTAEEAEGLEFI